MNKVHPQQNRVSSPLEYHTRDLDILEAYTTRGCDMGTNIHPLEISSSPALRTMLLYKGEGMLGSHPNFFKWIDGLLCIEAISSK
jgi:hypothetical protein